jgi:hypothetical protein
VTERDASATEAAPDPAVADANAAAEAFIGKWRGVPASELSTSQSFLLDLCALLGVDAPHATPEQDYLFERPVTFRHGDGSTSAGRIDLYKRGAFVLESKRLKAGAHTKGFDDALLRARGQAESYARALPAAEGRPPFLVVVDVGQRIELYSEFSRSGATYTPFPDPRSHRIALEDLRSREIRARLRRVWTDPLGLDPSRESARVTRQIAADLAELARRLELAGHDPEAVARFLMRCLFTMFAEDVRDTLDRLAQREAPLVTCIGRAAGQREDRYMHLLCGPAEAPTVAPMRQSPDAAFRSPGVHERLDQLERDIAELRAELAALKGAD